MPIKAVSTETRKPNGLHVMPNGDCWSVRRTGAIRASRVFASFRDALARARELARGKTIYVHDRAGRVEQRLT